MSTAVDIAGGRLCHHERFALAISCATHTQSTRHIEMTSPRSIITRLLRNIGSQKEVEQYLKQFASTDSRKFAVIKVGGGILESDLDGLASSLTFLYQVGLFPIVVHGAGPQLDEALNEAGVENLRVDGMRVTTPLTLQIARRVFQRENLRLVDALERLGTRARPLPSGVIEAELMDEAQLGLVGDVTRVHTEAIESSIRSGHLPILASLGETAEGQILNVNADVVARELALAVRPFKMIFLTPAGGLLDEDGRVLSSVNLAEDYERLLGEPWVHSGMRLKLMECKRLLDELSPSSSISITSPDQLARELFTHRGSGTLLRRGERVTRFENLEQIDRDRLRTLLETCFERELDQLYFDVRAFYRIYLAESYRATAIVTREGEIPYLDKFAVTRKAQGEGIGSSLWVRMSEETPKLYWRARNGNDINRWYFEHADGSVRSGKWTVFWYGLSGFDEIKECVDRALSLPATLRVHGAAGS